MASSLLVKARDKIVSANKRMRVLREKEHMGAIVTAAVAPFGAAGAAWVDREWGTPEEAATFGDTPAPVNGIVGLLGTIGSLAMPKMPLRQAFTGLFVGQMCAGAYRLAYDNLDQAEEEAAE
jgi:hypothetical protein